MRILEKIIDLFKAPNVKYFDEKRVNQVGHGFEFNGQTFVHHSGLTHQHNAFFRTSVMQRLMGVVVLGVVVVGLITAFHITLVVFVACLTIIYFLDLLFNLFLIARSFTKNPEIVIDREEIDAVEESEWPRYTILCPLYEEAEVLPQFVEAMSKLEYPTNKLQILLLLEDNDKETIRAAREMGLPEQFEIIAVPHSLPKTKPKACNFGLKVAEGEYSVIFDAEDIPEPDQLKKAVCAFRKLGPQIACVQAKLNFYNPRQNILTRVFTAEYSTWFDLMLTGMQSVHAPIPLGGTSNHFPTEVLKRLHGWDAFNVTEDCDLGMRLVKHGYRTAIIESTTWEEANSDLINWFWQRTRWIKGYIQTYFVHMRNSGKQNIRWRGWHAVMFQFVIGGKVMSLFINPVMWVITISYFVFRPWIGSFIESLYITPVFYMGIGSLVFGNFMYMYYYMIGCLKRGQDDLLKYVFMVPLYWIFMSVAAWVSVNQFIRRPHHWAKTKHGLHLNTTHDEISGVNTRFAIA